MTTNSDHYEIAIIGGGSAGLSAALLLARARRRVVVIDNGQPRNAPAAEVRGFITRDGCAPDELLDIARGEATSYGCQFISGEVSSIKADHQVHLSDGSQLSADRVLIATGLRDGLPDIPGVEQAWGNGVLHCPYCHGHEVGDGRVVVLGTSPNAVHQALLMTQWTPNVTLAVGDLDLTAEQRAMLDVRSVTCLEGTIEAVVESGGEVSAVQVNGDNVECDAVFVFPTPLPRDGFVDGLDLTRDQMGMLELLPTGQTSIPWLYAAGNVTDPRAQNITAAGDGAAVAHALHNELVMAEVMKAVAEKSQ